MRQPEDIKRNRKDFTIWCWEIENKLLWQNKVIIAFEESLYKTAESTASVFKYRGWKTELKKNQLIVSFPVKKGQS